MRIGWGRWSLVFMGYGRNNKNSFGVFYHFSMELFKASLRLLVSLSVLSLFAYLPPPGLCRHPKICKLLYHTIKAYVALLYVLVFSARRS
ncbi:hypothetical protein QBC42DRAFT_259050 [Cladorrhinum samala]|uniref:Uncharacterized protein n=1 Tax=Cladorrhinum samala TaxID=585594 RepID=A0AAV9I0D0_9PEZI|nr:hypothetical protein QBC42DRAFT_259050 [Cladorrhinum samala]